MTESEAQKLIAMLERCRLYPGWDSKFLKSVKNMAVENKELTHLQKLHLTRLGKKYQRQIEALK